MRLVTWRALSISSYPTGMNVKHLGVVGLLGGIGFTMSLFLIEIALVGQPNAAQAAKVRRCRLKPVAPRVESAWFQRLTLNCDELASGFAFNFNLRRYTKLAILVSSGVAAALGRGLHSSPSQLNLSRFWHKNTP